MFFFSIIGLFWLIYKLIVRFISFYRLIILILYFDLIILLNQFFMIFMFIYLGVFRKIWTKKNENKDHEHAK